MYPRTPMALMIPGLILDHSLQASM